MKILGMGANPLNSRDGIIVEGCKSILNIAKFDQYILIDDHNEQPINAFYPDEKFDLIVYCGTPWLWDGMQHTAKYMNTLAVIKAHPEAKVVWLGLGSSVYLTDINSSILRTPLDTKMLKTTFEGQLVVVRDSLAHEILNNAGVENHFLPCPSYFFNPVCETSREFDVIFYHAPETGISEGWWNKEKLKRYNDIIGNFYMNHDNVKVAVCDEREIQSWRDHISLTKPILLKDPIDTFNICKKARKVVSSRIHNAVPAMVYGAEVGIIPVDSRHLTISNHFDIIINSVTDLHKIKRCDIKGLIDVEEYRRLIKQHLEK